MPTLVLLLLAMLLIRVSADASSITIDSEKQLFLDDYLIESMTGVEREVQQAEKYSGNPVLRPTEPWEGDLALLFGSVLRENGKYRMWYFTKDGAACAESKDGTKWSKPALDVVEIGGRKTNMIFCKGQNDPPHYYEFMGVLRDDRETDPSRRYKLGYIGIERGYSGPREDPFHRGERRGLGVMGSPDGIHWKTIDPWATDAICDGVSTWMFDPARGRYILYGRTKLTPPEIEQAWSKYDWYGKWHWGRAVARTESTDFIDWNHKDPAGAPVVFTSDAKDEPGTEIYSIMVFPYEGVYIALVQTYLARPDASWIDIQLATSRDGVHFTRVADRKPFIPLGPAGSWDRFNHSVANNPPIETGDELRFYYSGRTQRHNPYDGPDKGVPGSGIGFASIRRDRFVALQASFRGGEIITKPLRLTGKRLHLNAKSGFGAITVEALDGAGQVLARSKPVRQDALDIPVEWESGGSALVDVAIRLRIRLENAQIFALWSE